MDIYVAWGVLISLFVFGVAPMIMAMATGIDYKKCIHPTITFMLGVAGILACGGFVLWAAITVVTY